jgi:hypothetical protein
MQITVTNDFNTFGGFNQQQINSFLADEQTAINILDAAFTDNISVVYDVGFGSFEGQVMPNQTISEANVNTNAVFFLTYSQLRQDLLTFGQPNFFNAANLPAGNSINGVTNFWVSSSVGAIFGLFTAQTDGFVGIGTGFTPGPQRVPPSCTSSGMPWGASRSSSAEPLPRSTCGASPTLASASSTAISQPLHRLTFRSTAV